MNLAPDIYIAHIDHRSVILDLNRDRYIGLNEFLSDTIRLLAVSAGNDLRISSARKASIEKLSRQGVLTDQGHDKYCTISNSMNVSQPAASIWPLLSDERTSDAPISLVGMMSAFISLTQMATSLSVQPFKSTISWIAKTKVTAPGCRADSSAQTLGRAQILVDAFYEIRPYFPLKPICRLDAPALCLHLRRNGQHAQLVFGVRLDPFKAHCWVQIGDVAIREPWARVRQYTPILVV